MLDALVSSIDGRRFAVYRPTGYTTARRWPLILFLHGAGETGDDGLRPTRVGIGPALERYPERYPAVVVFPQCPRSSYWVGAVLNRAIDAMDATINAESIDTSRVYLTGISMGGFGAFLLATLHPERFAAVVPVCGGGQPQTMAPILARLPLWIFHGAADPVIPVEYSREMVEAIRRHNPVELRYTEYPDVEHNSWDPAYAEPELPAWLLSHQRVTAGRGSKPRKRGV